MTDANFTSFMPQAVALAREAQELGEVPVGAVVVEAGKVVGRGYNRPDGHFAKFLRLPRQYQGLRHERGEIGVGHAERLARSRHESQSARTGREIGGNA